MSRAFAYGFGDTWVSGPYHEIMAGGLRGVIYGL